MDLRTHKTAEDQVQGSEFDGLFCDGEILLELARSSDILQACANIWLHTLSV